MGFGSAYLLLSLGVILHGHLCVAFYANIDRLTDEAFNDPTVKWLATPKTRGISSCSAPSQLKLQAFDTSVRGVTIDMELKEVYNYVFDLAGSATAYANGGNMEGEIYSIGKTLYVYNKLGGRVGYHTNAIQPGTVKIILDDGGYAVYSNDKLVASRRDKSMFRFPMGTSALYLGMNSVLHPSYMSSRKGRGVCSVKITWAYPDFAANISYYGWSIPSNTPEIQWHVSPSRGSSTSYRTQCRNTAVIRLMKSPPGATGFSVIFEMKQIYRYLFHISTTYSRARGFGSGPAEIHNDGSDFHAYMDNKQMLALVPDMIQTGNVNITLLTNETTGSHDEKMLYKSEMNMFEFPISGEGIYIGINRLLGSGASGYGTCYFEINWLYGGGKRSLRSWNDDDYEPEEEIW